MRELKLSKHQVIARELFGENKQTYEMERADLYQRLSYLVVRGAAVSVEETLPELTPESENEIRARSYMMGYDAQLEDAAVGNDKNLDQLISDVKTLIETSRDI